MVLLACGPVGNSRLQMEDVPTPVPREGEVRVLVEACGVCHTDLHTVEGDLGDDRLPLIPGHEVIGVVDELGEGCARFSPGDRVGLAWLHHTCGTCRYCTTGRENLCESAAFTGYDANGGYAEFVTVPEAFAYPVPAGLAPEAAAPLMCAGIIGYRALRVSGIQPGGRLGLYGFGASAHIAIQIARHWGCEVCVFTRSDDHKAHALELGAAWAGEAAVPPPAPLDAAVNFTPAGWTVPYGLQALDRGGTLALAGIHMSDLPEMVYERDLYYERSLRSVTASTRQDGEDLLRLAAEIPIQTTTTAYPLADANSVLQALKRREVRGAAVLAP